MTVLLAGGTGLVGRELLNALLASKQTQVIHALVRRLPDHPPADARLHWLQVDFSALPPLPVADTALCALGTTIKAAGSQAAFRAVDFDAVLAFARTARTAGVRRFGVVSALGANPKSRNFYNRVKGEMEAALTTLGFERLVIARPSLLLGQRSDLGQPERPGEKVAEALTRPFGGLIPKAWRPIEAATVARGLHLAMSADGAAGVRIVESGELQTLGTH
jgi:uncharacterized protein YbjT (DUF2867 family)